MMTNIRSKADVLRLPAGAVLVITECFRPERIGQRSTVEKRSGSELILNRWDAGGLVRSYMALGKGWTVEGRADGFAYGSTIDPARVVYRVEVCRDCERRDRETGGAFPWCNDHRDGRALPCPFPMTREAWSALHPDFKGVRADGTKVRNMLNPETGGTESWPVLLVD